MTRVAAVIYKDSKCGGLGMHGWGMSVGRAVNCSLNSGCSQQCCCQSLSSKWHYSTAELFQPRSCEVCCNFELQVLGRSFADNRPVRKGTQQSTDASWLSSLVDKPDRKGLVQLKQFFLARVCVCVCVRVPKLQPDVHSRLTVG